MKTTTFFKLAIALLAVIAVSIATPSFAQTAFKSNGKSVITLKGTSTLHDWTMQAKSFTTNAQMMLAENNSLTGVAGLTLVLPVVNLKSEKDGLNENAWETLEYEDHKNIIYKMTSATVAPAGANKYQITANGNLTIAGKTKPVSMTASAVANADGSFTCTGNLAIKLSQFNIERPSFMFGTMSVGDAMTLSYSVNFVR